MLGIGHAGFGRQFGECHQQQCWQGASNRSHISHEGLRILLCEEGVGFQRVKTWKTSCDPDYAAKKARVEHLCAIADGEVIPGADEPEVVICLDEFGPLT